MKRILFFPIWKPIVWIAERIESRRLKKMYQEIGLVDPRDVMTDAEWRWSCDVLVHSRYVTDNTPRSMKQRVLGLWDALVSWALELEDYR